MRISHSVILCNNQVDVKNGMVMQQRLEQLNMRLFKEVNVGDRMGKPTRKDFRFNVASLKKYMSGV